eukprot:TRINITY_DN95816_c0_g1_i1.p1 TRINITY_DN95816_c0_g1~~TRINITY_DN95816_c0_g1_i1.p1  ORF type:complete len:363 (-),score=72.68 TRINITY_DN95816_c0_g1_i1:384-1472(-)
MDSFDVLTIMEVAPESAYGSGHGLKPTRPPFCGWLTERQLAGLGEYSESSVRYYTLDFRAQILYSACSEANLRASSPISFSSLLLVEPLPFSLPETTEDLPSVPCVEACEIESMGFATGHPGIVTHGLLLRTRCGTTLELTCSSKCQAEAWLTAFHEAIDLAAVGKARASSIVHKADCSTVASSQISSRRASPSPKDSPQALSPRCEEVELGNEEVQPSPPAFASGEHISAWRSVPPSREAVGGDAGRQSAICADFLVNATPRGVNASAWGAELELRGEESRPSDATERYADKAKGLSLQERLCQLDLSDDEDDEDAALQEAGVAAPSPPSVLQEAPPTVTIDVCESFQEPESEAQTPRHVG